MDEFERIAKDLAIRLIGIEYCCTLHCNREAQFIPIIATALRKAVLDEREACAKIAESVPEGCCEEYSDCPLAIAAAIRGRTKNDTRTV